MFAFTFCCVFMLGNCLVLDYPKELDHEDWLFNSTRNLAQKGIGSLPKLGCGFGHTQRCDSMEVARKMVRINTTELF